MSTEEHEWKGGTWVGVRRDQIRRSLRKSVRERLAELEDLSETSDALARLGTSHRATTMTQPRTAHSEHVVREG